MIYIVSRNLWAIRRMQDLPEWWIWHKREGMYTVVAPRPQAPPRKSYLTPHLTIPREEGSALGSRVARRPRTSLLSVTHSRREYCQRTSLNASPCTQHNRTLALVSPLEYMETGRARFWHIIFLRLFKWRLNWFVRGTLVHENRLQSLSVHPRLQLYFLSVFKYEV